MNRSITIALSVFLGYYCLYDLTSTHSFLPPTVSNLIVSIVLLFTLLLQIINQKRLLSSQSICWFPFIVVIFVNMIHYNSMPKSYLLIYLLFAAMFSNPDISLCNFKNAIKVLKIMGLIGVLGVLIQLLIPSIYIIIARLLFSQEGLAYVGEYAGRGYYSGFYHQVGDTAFYVSGAIIAYAFIDKSTINNKLTLFFLFLMLFLLGKRASLLFLVAAFLVTYIAKEESKSNKVVKVLASVIISVVFIFILKYLTSVFPDVKFFEKLAYTFNYLSEGNIEDLLDDSGRLVLYAYAQQLFLENTWTGIGWAQFSLLVSDILPSGTSLSVHNIYLQLLCETGLIGFTSFMLGVFSSAYALIRSKKMLNIYCGCDKVELKKYFCISLTGQIYFLMCCFVENPIYNENCLIFYFLMVFMNCVLMERLKKQSFVVSPNVQPA